MYVFGGRSFSIFDTAGNLVFDSGDDFEQITAAEFPDFFNANNDNNKFDNRSDNKGPEPEAVAIGLVCGKYYAFIGLERVGGVMVYDITDPAAATFVTYLNNRDFEEDPEDGTSLDLGPEEIIFIPADESPVGVALIAVSNEVSGTVTIYTISQDEICENIPNVDALAVDFCDEPNITVDFPPVDGATSYILEIILDDKTLTKTIPTVPFTRSVNIPSDYNGATVSVKIAAVFDEVVGDFSEVVDVELGCTDIEQRSEVVIEPEIVVYPNPARDFLKINGDVLDNKVKIYIFDSVGRIVVQTNYTNIIDISDLKPGSYTLKFNKGENVIMKKFMKL